MHTVEHIASQIRMWARIQDLTADEAMLITSLMERDYYRRRMNEVLTDLLANIVREERARLDYDDSWLDRIPQEDVT